MTHRIETILAQAQTLVTGLATTGNNVFRGRATPLSHQKPKVEVPGLLLAQGGDEVLENHGGVILLGSLGFEIAAVVVGEENQLDTLLNLIRAEVTVALQADHTLGLPFVHQLEELGADQPEHDSSGERPMAQQRTRWRVTFDRSRTDPAN